MATIPVQNETKNSFIRQTNDGRTLRYTLTVIQQPERARACGSGAKSSADRRPVDPPPIVELRVHEGDNEITFAHNANFFLFATLENARAIAPGRNGPPPATNYPVLTGTPVAGMAYLDRPTPAGYFIFPDLSVRHEGKYRLSFALYEELKERKDRAPEDDRDTPVAGQPKMQDTAQNHVFFRVEVKSAPFIVFSAKKFPGLSESTALSRMVAEQGCRVRIRRDVRMRRRENKSNKDWDDFEDEPAGGYEAARRTATPDAYAQQQPGVPTPEGQGERPRSVSNASSATYAAAPRRPSMDEMAQPYPASNSYQQMPPPQNASYSQMPQYGQSQYQSQYAPPQSAAPLMQPPQAPYAHQSHQPTHNNYQGNSTMHMTQPYGYMNNQSYQQNHYEQPAPVRTDSAVAGYEQQTPDYRRPSVSLPQTTHHYPGPSQMMPPFSPMEYNRQQHINSQIPPLQTSGHNAPVSTPNAMHMPNGHSLAPLKSLQTQVPPEKLEPVSPSYQSPPNNMSAPMSAASEVAPHNNYLDSRASIAKYGGQSPAAPQSIGQKRSFSSTFDTKHVNDRLQQGARPNPSAPAYGYDGGYDEPDMEEPMDRSAMSYRRADGTHRQRRVPGLGV
jgi:hypothetical protein